MKIPRTATTLLALAACLLVHEPLAAQLDGYGFHLGLGRSSLGGGFADLTEDAGYDLISRTGLVAGAWVDYGLPGVHERLSVRAGLGVAQKGNRIERDGDDFRLLDLTYVDLPVLALVALGSGDWSPYAVAGPVLSLKQGSYAESEGQEIDADDELKGTDVGLALGIGARQDRLGAEVRYVHGFPNITTHSSPNESATNRQWSVALSYWIPITR